MHKLPSPAAKARLLEIAALIDAGYNAAFAKFEGLMRDLPVDLQAQVEAVQNEYWIGTVTPHLQEIADLTNNSATTLASVFAPQATRYDLGGISPAALRLLATDMRWRP